MVETVLNDKNAKGQIITTSFKFDEIVNLLPIIFDFKLSGSTGFPSTLQTGTFDRTSYVVASGLSNNVSKLHEYLYGEKNYVPTENVNSVDYAVTSKTGISENSAGFNPTEKVMELLLLKMASSLKQLKVALTMMTKGKVIFTKTFYFNI